MIAATLAMPDEFIPLRSAAPAQPAAFAALEVKVVTQAASHPAFQPLETKPADQSHLSESCGQPVVTLQRDGDVVSRIRIQCGCGQVLDLDCAY